MNGPFLLLRSTFYFAGVGYRAVTRTLGKRGKAAFWGGFILSAFVAVYLQVTH